MFAISLLVKKEVSDAALKFQHFLLQQMKCQGNYTKTHFASALPWQCFCRGYLGNLGKNID